MPAFIVIGHKVRTDSEFTLNDLAGSTGRLDVLLRCVNSALLLSNGIRRDVDLYLVLLGEPDPPKTVRFEGAILQHLNPDERSTGALVKNALEKDIIDGELHSSPGIFVSREGLADVLGRFADNRFVYLREDGRDHLGAGIGKDDVYVLGGHEDLTEEEEGLLVDKTISISLGPNSLHAHHCITVVHNYLDRL